ncbi:MAG: isoprenylcysteine carboxylmethyltransferase family protein [Rhizobiaceae bacterium]
MKATDEKPNTIPWPPIILASTIAGGIALGWFVPLPWAVQPAADILQGVGIVAMVIAVILYSSAFTVMQRARTNILPHRAADQLVTSGPFAFTRNPIYLANVFLIAGLGLAFANFWLVIASVVCGLLEHRFGILREEAHLEHKFGKSWRDYRKRVRRWI